MMHGQKNIKYTDWS